MPCIILRNLYFTLVHPYFEYCNVIWAVNKTVSLDNLFRKQKRAIRVVTNSKWNSHTAPLFVKLNVLTLYNINALQKILVYDVVIDDIMISNKVE